MIIKPSEFNPEHLWSIFRPGLLAAETLFLATHHSPTEHLEAEVEALEKVGKVVAWHRGFDAWRPAAGYHTSGITLLWLEPQDRELENLVGEIEWFDLAANHGVETEKYEVRREIRFLSGAEPPPKPSRKIPPQITRAAKGGFFAVNSAGEEWWEVQAAKRGRQTAAMTEAGWAEKEKVHWLVHEAIQTRIGGAPYNFLHLVCPETTLEWALSAIDGGRLERDGGFNVDEWDNIGGLGFIDYDWAREWLAYGGEGRSAEVELAGRLAVAMRDAGADELEAAVKAVIEKERRR